MNAAALNHDEMKLSPIIFSHGLCNYSAIYSQHNLELASHGYIVFVPNHNDGTCCYTEKSDGTPVVFDRTKNNKHFTNNGKQYIDVRTKEISALIEEMGSEGFLANTLNFPQNVTLDMSTLSIFGHSFGATTAIAAAV